MAGRRKRTDEILYPGIIKELTAGLSGWRHLAGKKRDFVAESNGRLTRVLDHLIKSGIADPKRIAACGTSRGGFLAIHFAVHDKASGR